MSNEVEIVVRARDQSAAGIDAATRRIRVLKDEARSVPNVKVTADADIAGALAELGVFRDAAGRLRNMDGRFTMDADVKRAVAEIEGVEEDVRRVDGKQANVSVDANVGGALAKIALVGAALAALSVAAAGVGIAAGIGAVGAVGFGAIAAGLSGVGEAVGAMGKKVGGAGGAASSTAKAVRGAAEQIIKAKEGVVQANRDLDAANRGVGRSEEDLARAQREAKDAQEQLNDARTQAARDLQDLTDQVADNALAQRRATMDVEAAQNNLNNVMANRTATLAQRDDAQLTYDEAVQHQTDLSHRVQQTAQDQADAAKKGVEGSDRVVQAHQRVDDSLRKIRDAQQGVADAHLKVTEAQEHLADAIRQVTIAQQNAADAAKSAGSSGASGVNTLAAAMANLSPAGQKFAKFMRGFIDGPLKELRFAAQEGLLPPLQAALEKLGPVIHKLAPGFQAFAGAIGTALGGTIGIVAKLAPGFLKFATVALQGLAPLGPVMSTFATAFGTMVDKVTKNGSLKGAMQGFVDILGAVVDFLPGLVDAGLGIAAALGPQFAGLLKQLGPLFIEIAKAVGPILVAALKIVIPVLKDLTDWIADHQGLFSAFLIFLGLVTIAVWAITSPVSAIILAFVIVAASLVVLYQRSETFRTIVLKVRDAFVAFWNKIVDVYNWVKTNGPKIYHAIADAFSNAVQWVKDKWNALVGFVKGLPDRVTSALHGMWDGFKSAVAAAIQWARDKVQALLDMIAGIPGRIRDALIGSNNYTVSATVTNSPQSNHLQPFVGRATGGIVGHAAEGGPRNGLTMVGEYGRELVRLAPGSTVHSNPDTERLLGGGGGAARVVLEINSSGSAMDDYLVQMIRKAVRTRGGNVQSALGT